MAFHIGLTQYIVAGTQHIFPKTDLGNMRLVGQSQDGQYCSEIAFTLYAPLNRTTNLDLALFVDTLPAEVGIELKRVTNFITLTYQWNADF